MTGFALSFPYVAPLYVCRQRPSSFNLSNRQPHNMEKTGEIESTRGKRAKLRETSATSFNLPNRQQQQRTTTTMHFFKKAGEREHQSDARNTPRKFNDPRPGHHRPRPKSLRPASARSGVFVPIGGGGGVRSTRRNHRWYQFDRRSVA